MKLYTISGLGADEKVLEKLTFNQNIEVVHIPWLIPNLNEDFYEYILRMSESIDDSEEFYLLGYSFGGIIVQEIHKLKPAKKIVILGSIRCDAEKSRLIKAGQKTNAIKYIPTRVFNGNTTLFYSFFRKLFDPKNPRLNQYFRVKDPYYLKWSMDKVAHWKFDKIPDVIQILADKDIVFPIKNSQPDFVIKNATHLFPATKPKEVSEILKTIFV
ncbi:alpha/beta hydrolase [Epilithonimonas sp. JDS]|uniref:alpha/beta hydrolase n=1 Tax=Epilithonimonas sp. JDS TaxID=2902797 RepID=UPI001E3506CE|nr:alpha/beta hydrolase [Epilithonimonas sp. JDS]MCD9854989.1 alpha/beta hydrolase [Epilithonimonas sp. JDS]